MKNPKTQNQHGIRVFISLLYVSQLVCQSVETISFEQIVVKTSFRFETNTYVASNNPIVFESSTLKTSGTVRIFRISQHCSKGQIFLCMYLMKFDKNRSLRNVKFSFEIQILSQYKVSFSVGGLIPWGKYRHGVVASQGRYLSQEFISTSKTNF